MAGFTQKHIDAIDDAIAKKKANPGMDFLGDIAQAVVDAAQVAGAVTAVVGADTAPADPSTLKGKVPKGGFSLDDLNKAREHAIKNRA